MNRNKVILSNAEGSDNTNCCFTRFPRFDGCGWERFKEKKVVFIKGTNQKVLV